MNRHKKAVEASRSRNRVATRFASFIGAALVIVLALWVADFKIGNVDLARSWQSVKDWWSKDWFPEKDERYAIPPQLPTPPTVPKTTDPNKPLPGTESSTSATPLSLVLVSTERGRNAREGTARIGTHLENPQTYSAGAILANGARLLEIYNDHVVLERDGQKVNLFPPGSSKKSTSDLLLVGGTSAYASPKQATAYTEVLTDYIRPSPVYDGPLLKGYQVYAGTRSGVFSQLGLQNGDVILALDDQPFVDGRQMMDLFHQLTSGAAMSATIERNGAKERISLDGALITADVARDKNPPANSPASMPM